eukprot:CCRYP_004866-RA/>CCRYP_004866-RA protein AED:0.03 eAED:0.03 QI:72/1/1/1/1/1/2/42/614
MSRPDEDPDADMSSLYVQANAIRGATSDIGSTLPPPTLDDLDVDRITSFDATDAEGEFRKSSSRPAARRDLARWWSNVLSRVSRSASSLLSQHSPNLNELLEGGGQNPIATVEEEGRGTCGGRPSEQNASEEVCDLRAEVERLKERIRQLEDTRAEELRDSRYRPSNSSEVSSKPTNAALPFLETQSHIPTLTTVQTLQPQQISRYSRQLLLSDGFGLAGQKKLLSSSVLVVGAGGIGSTVLLYLAASGVGHITIVDYDVVEMSNLHRQIIHKDHDSSYANERVGMNKAQSAKASMLALNPTISITALDVIMDADNVMELVSRHDVVVDASDNPRTRYLLNDACIFADKALVSGSAMGTEGQLTVYNYRGVHEVDCCNAKKTACYRCLYPNPNPVEGCKSCSDNGVLGPVPGLIGVLQAVEVIKVLTGIGKVMHDRLLMYDSLPCSFINIKKPPPKQNCAICSPQATIKRISDTEQSLQCARGPSVCTVPVQTSKLSQDQHISCIDYDNLRKTGQPHVLLDVRVTRQYEMCSLDGSVNIPLVELETKLDKVDELSNGILPVYCLCRRGIASVEATRIIQRSIEEGKYKKIHSVYNIDGGLNSWVKTVDSEFPWY